LLQKKYEQLMKAKKQRGIQPFLYIFFELNYLRSNILNQR